MTSEMLSGLTADMTASASIDRAIGLPSPAWHRTESGALLSFRALFEITSAFVSTGFYPPLGLLSLEQSLKGFSCRPPGAAQFEMPLAKPDSRKAFVRPRFVVTATGRDVV